MKLSNRERRLIQAPVALVYTAIADPQNWPGFIKKIKSIRGNAEWFGGVVTSKREERDFSGQITAAEPHRLVQAQIKVEDDHAISFDVTYLLEEAASGTLVTEEVQFGGHIPFWGWLLIRIIQRLGRPAAPSNLEMLDSFVQRVLAQSEAPTQVEDSAAPDAPSRAA